MSKEIEYKFLIPENNVKKLKKVLTKKFGAPKVYDMQQFYLKIAANDEERIRRKKDVVSGKETYLFTRKTGQGLVREETEREITKNKFEKLAEKAIAKVEKRRYKFHSNKISNIVEIVVDIYTDRDLAVMEVELKNKDLPRIIEKIVEKFELKDVTKDSKYKNKNLAKKTR